MDRYIDGKTDFVLRILGVIGFSEMELAAIRSINQMDNTRPDTVGQPPR
ncbi:MAG TPA: hypothetical protein VFD64_00610 [Gemmatimonadaceae bacterium]|nr:hypothetical protein [Gemmatimonadaceae bacterium]